MAIITEDGTGVASAATYAAIATIDAYWAARPHDPLATAWAAATTVNKEGAAREATAFLDAAFGPFYRGIRRGYVQGLLQPRSGAMDDAGYPLPDLPGELVAATCELAARALSDRLAADIDQSARVRREKVGPLETEYFENGLSAPVVTYGVVGNMLSPILNGSQPGAPNVSWAWA